MQGKTKTYNPKISEFNRPEEFSFEKYDCTVRSLAAATGISYSNSHKMMARFSYRKNREGAYFPYFLKLCHIYDIFTEEDSSRPTIIPNEMFNGLTLNKLFQEPVFLKKKWIVRVRRHVFCVDRGTIYTLKNKVGRSEKAKKKVMKCYEIIE